MSKLAVGRNDLRAAYHEFSGLVDVATARPDGRHARAVLLCGLYAVECGLKALLLETRQVSTTAALDDDDEAFTHDPNRLLELLGQPANFPNSISAARPAGAGVHVSKYQELVRYGGLFSVGDERRFIGEMRTALEFVRENL